MAKEEYLMRLSILQQEAGKVEEQIQIINQQLGEFEILKNGLDKFDKENSEEILAPVGRGIYIKSKPLDKKLFVNVGMGTVVRKTPQETEKIIEKQIKQMQDIKTDLMGHLEKINLEMQKLVVEAQKEQSKA